MRSVLGVDGSPAAAKRQLAVDLLRNRQLAQTVATAGTFKLPGGSRQWSMADYTDMVVRTTTREAVTEGAKARMVTNGLTLARYVVSATACPKCLPFAGKLLDLTGTSGGTFEGEAVLSGPFPPIHPRCTCTISPVATRIESLRRELANA